MTSRERVAAALDHREPDRVPVDLGSCGVTGMHVSCVYALRQSLGLDPPGTPVKVVETYQLLGEIAPDLQEAVMQEGPAELRVGVLPGGVAGRAPQRGARAAGDDVGEAAGKLRPLVQVVVPGEHGRGLVLPEQGDDDPLAGEDGVLAGLAGVRVDPAVLSRRPRRIVGDEEDELGPGSGEDLR